jgi:hypothetical protein
MCETTLRNESWTRLMPVDIATTLRGYRRIDSIRNAGTVTSQNIVNSGRHSGTPGEQLAKEAVLDAKQNYRLIRRECGAQVEMHSKTTTREP